MRINLNTLQNSTNYFKESILISGKADEFGNHSKDKCDFELKIKWKLGFICAVQALELLCKNILKEINPQLVHKDIDIQNTGSNKTINLLISLTRLDNFSTYSIDLKNEAYIKKAISIRNRFIHDDVLMYTEELKSLFCKLIKLYTDIYSHFYDISDLRDIIEHRDYLNFMSFEQYLVPYRGTEVPKDSVDEIIRETRENQKFKYYISNGIKYDRVRQGEERNRFPELFENVEGLIVYDFEYCDDCSAKCGEFHEPFCDLEICPKCKRQRMTCDCFDSYHY